MTRATGKLYDIDVHCTMQQHKLDLTSLKILENDDQLVNPVRFQSQKSFQFHVCLHVFSDCLDFPSTSSTSTIISSFSFSPHHSVLHEKSEILLIEVEPRMLGDQTWQGWHIFHKKLVVILARYIPFFTRLITVIARRAGSVGSALVTVPRLVVILFLSVLFTGVSGVCCGCSVGVPRSGRGRSWFAICLLFLVEELREHLGRAFRSGVAVRTRGSSGGRSSRKSLPGGFDALLVILALQVSVEVDRRCGDEVADEAADFHVLKLDLVDRLEHASVLLALHVRLEDDPRVEFEVAHFAGKVAFVRRVDFRKLSFLAGFPLFFFDSLHGGYRSEWFGGQE